MNKAKMWSDSLQMGEMLLRNRIVMAPMNRCRCKEHNGVVSDLEAEYYYQRAEAGLIISESTAWSARGQGLLHGAALYNEEHVFGWRKVTKRVHERGGKIVVQLFHAGRVTHDLKNWGLGVWAASPIQLREEKIVDLDNIDHPVPKEMTVEDINETKNEFEKSVLLAKEAGFDGIELHGGQGYLVDGFLRSGTNTRTDIYGGSVINRCRFALELLDLALKHLPSTAIGIKVTPVSRMKDSYDENPVETFIYFMQELSRRKIGFVEVRESTEKSIQKNLYPLNSKEQMEDVCAVLRPHFNGLLIANDYFNAESGLNKIRAGLCDAISFGKLYIVNPDLAERIIKGYPTNRNWEYSTFYDWNLGGKGYTDYPTYEQEQLLK